MNVTVETLAACRRLVRIEVDAQAVDAALAEATKEIQKYVSLPGFRQGKAPRDLIAKRYEKDILDEAKRKLLNDSYKKAIAENKLEVIGMPDIEEIQFGRGKAFQFAATVDIAPEFQLPEYKGLPAKRETTTVTDADVDKAIDMLRSQQAKYEKAERAAETGDVAIVNFTGTVEGKPITELAPAAKGLGAHQGFWVRMEKGEFLPAFADQLMGAKAGEKRTVNVDFPAEFVTPELAGKKGVYEVEVTEVRAKVLPPLDEAFAKSYGAESLDKLREGVRKDLENELDFKKRRDVRSQVVQALLSQITCDLPESAVGHETRNVVYNIVSENQRRGISKETIESAKDQIYSSAAASARERVKANFVFHRIAEKENIKVTQEQMLTRIYTLASQYGMTPDKFAKELQKRDGVPEIAEQLLVEKVVDFLADNAKIEDVAPAAPAAPATPA